MCRYIRPWPHAEIWIDPEIDQGFGFSNTFGCGGLRAAELVQVGLELLGLTAQIYGLAKEAALYKKIRIRLAYFESFAAGISR